LKKEKISGRYSFSVIYPIPVGREKTHATVDRSPHYRLDAIASEKIAIYDHVPTQIMPQGAMSCSAGVYCFIFIA